MENMAFPLPTPAVIADLTRAAIGQALETAAAAATVPVRMMTLLGQTELLINRVAMLADQAEALIGRVSAVADAADAIVARAEVITGAAGAVVTDTTGITRRASDAVEQAAQAAGTATELLDEYSQTLRKGAPLARRFVDELSPDEVTAAIRVVDQLPRLREHLVDDVMPLLGKLDQMGPDLHKLLEVTEDLHLAIVGLPGLKLLRRRGEDRTEDSR